LRIQSSNILLMIINVRNYFSLNECHSLKNRVTELLNCIYKKVIKRSWIQMKNIWYDYFFNILQMNWLLVSFIIYGKNLKYMMQSIIDLELYRTRKTSEEVSLPLLLLTLLSIVWRLSQYNAIFLPIFSNRITCC
jgi:hypothetical protein